MSRQQYIITGVNGFVAEHLAKELCGMGYEILGIGREDTPNKRVSKYLDNYFQADLLDRSSLQNIPFENISGIVNLAGLASVGQSFERPLEYFNDNGTIIFNLVSEALKHKFKGRLLSISTGALYNPNVSLPIAEDSTLNYNSPYSIGKIHSEHISNYFRDSGVDIVIARPFNHIGPGQGLGFLLPDLNNQIDNAALNNEKFITVGNLTTKRDYTDVRDIVKAYALLLTTPVLKKSVYNIASNKSVSGTGLLNLILKEKNVSSLNIVVDNSKVRPNDILDIRGDTTRIQQELGWSPTIPIEITVRDFVKAAE